MGELRCQTRAVTGRTPRHRGQAMHCQDVDGKAMPVCWMGARCDIEAVPEHCGKPMTAGW